MESGGSGGQTIDNCWNSGEIYAKIETDEVIFASGIGKATEITNCYNIGNVTGIQEGVTSSNYYVSAAGICSYSGKSVSNCFNLGSITSQSDSYYSRASGIGFYCSSTNCYNIGSVTAIGSEDNIISAGGISAEGGTLVNCYNIGTTSGTSGNTQKIGAIMGWSNSGTATDCYYLSSTADSGIGSGTDTTTAIDNIEDMPSVLSIVGDEFKEDTNNINNGYPILNWQ